MALNKSVTLNNGCVVSYHKISNILLDADNGMTAEVSVNSYVNQEYRDKEYPADRRSYSIDISEEEEIGGQGIRELLYNKLKEMPEWQDSADC